MTSSERPTETANGRLAHAARLAPSKVLNPDSLRLHGGVTRDAPVLVVLAAGLADEAKVMVEKAIAHVKTVGAEQVGLQHAVAAPRVGPDPLLDPGDHNEWPLEALGAVSSQDTYASSPGRRLA